ncbi:MAG: phospholipase D-like domain-containing protein [candidate division Zixibacteria bacterium]|nr:phospholipase D-like domain-containing protein [candidate division Zixibacteria bacterium]
MKLEILNQYAGVNPVGDIIINTLNRDRAKFQHVKFLMAFVSDYGLSYICKALKTYYDSGGILEFIVGIDNGITSFNALAYINRSFPETDLFVLHDSSSKCCFHTKVVIFEGEKYVTVLLGSANLTLGGLYANCETTAIIELDREKDSDIVDSIQSIWNCFRNPKGPLNQNNIQQVSSEWLKKVKATLIKWNKRHKKVGNKSKMDFAFASVPFILPRFAKINIRNSLKKVTRVDNISGQTFYLEIYKETGLGGTQVQIPTKALPFFNKNIGRPIHIRIKVADTDVRDAYIHHFRNNTHRITIRELSGIKRPAIVKFKKSSHEYNTYTCDIITGGQYTKSLAKCKNKTRSGAKGWGIE